MESKKKLDVFLKFSREEIPVGQLVQDGKSILFKYRSEYLANGFNISPKKLLFDDSVQRTNNFPFQGLFGVFDDSLPDAWGNLLLRRWLNSKLIPIEQITVLDRLSFVGENGPGALLYRPSNDEETSNEALDLDFLDDHLEAILTGESEEIVADLFKKGGSPGGARPKIYAGYNPVKNTLIYGSNELPESFEHWMIKFSAVTDPTDSANCEMAYYLMATAAGIEMSESKLLNGKSGKSYFATKRFDRNHDQRLHLVSAAGMFHDDYEHSQLDYGMLIHETDRLINNYVVTEQQFRRAVFNVFAHNRDDHSKNFAFLMDAKGNWNLAPAFDLTFSSSSQGMHSTTVARNGVDPGTKELMNLAEHFSIREGEKIISEVKSVIKEWESFADQTNVQKNTAKSISTRLKEINRF
ncbi:putative DNA-binding transcriptional regulator [compost metagenome]